MKNRRSRPHTENKFNCYICGLQFNENFPPVQLAGFACTINVHDYCKKAAFWNINL